MDYEKSYKDALERAKKLKETCDSTAVIGWCEHIFPELKGNEDRKIRNAIYDALKYLEREHSWDFLGDVDILDAYTWLEKQGEQKSVEDSLTLEEFENAFITKAKQYDIDLPNRSWDIYALCKELYSLKHKPKQGEKNPAEWHIEDEQNLNACLGYIPDELLRRWLKDVIHAKYDKPINKLEAKFHEGDWVVTDKGDTVQIETVNNDYYTIGNGMLFSMPYVDTCWHSWTIQDAKDGDVLAVDWYQGDDSWEKIIIFKKYHKNGIEGLINTPCVEGYGNTFKNRKMTFDEEVPYFSKTWTDNLHPATKEQRDLLFARMEEEGCVRQELIKL